MFLEALSSSLALIQCPLLQDSSVSDTGMGTEMFICAIYVGELVYYFYACDPLMETIVLLHLQSVSVVYH